MRRYTAVITICAIAGFLSGLAYVSSKHTSMREDQALRLKATNDLVAKAEEVEKGPDGKPSFDETLSYLRDLGYNLPDISKETKLRYTLIKEPVPYFPPNANHIRQVELVLNGRSRGSVPESNFERLIAQNSPKE